MFLSQVRQRLMLLVAVLSVLLVPAGAFAAPVPQPPLCFKVPGITNCISGRFLQYWTQNGGLAVFGYPITAVTLERTAEGTFPTQYFERARFEYHPEHAGTPYETELGRLGAADAAQRDLLGSEPFRPRDTGPTGRAGCTFFAELRHEVCGGFRDYWQSHGLEFGDPGISYREALALFGLPMSEEFTDPATGLTVQYFERARFEYHPNNPEGFRVLLTRLGADLITARGW